MSELRVLIASHTYTAPINRAKLETLAQDVALTAVVPSRWSDALFTVKSDARAAEGYTLHSFPIRSSGHILRYFFPFRRLTRVVREARPDVVCVEEEPASLALAQLAYLKGRFQYRLIFFTWDNIRRRVGLPGVERYNLRRCDGAIAGNGEAREVIRSKGFRGPIQMTPQLGVDPEFFRPARSHDLRQSLGLAGFVAGYVGLLVEEKGVRLLVEAARDLPDVQLLIVGGGPLRHEIQSATHGQAVELIDAVPHERIVAYLNALDALVLPSLTTRTWKEQFGHVLIEAMACGVPVIGSSSGAIPEVIGEAGVVFPEGDAAALRAAIAGLRENPDRRFELARAGRERVLERYTHDRVAAANAEFFAQVRRA